MKQLFLIFLLLPALAFAQIDKKYGVGAVPLIDNKVVFSRSFEVPGQLQNQIYLKALDWAKVRFTPKDEFQSRILFSDPNTGQIACLGQQYLVFANKVLSLDRATISYQMQIEVTDGKCQAKINAIRYIYNYGDKNEVIAAEEQITDEHSFTKKMDKMLKATGKFRTHTIDLTEELFSGLSTAIGISEDTPSLPSATTAAIPAAGESNLAGYKQITPDKIPGNIYKMLENDWMLITAGNDQQFNMMTASWGGLGNLYNKPVTFCFINPTRYTFPLMENGDTYTLSFYTETYRDALNYCGSHSGKNEDKVKGAGLSPITTPSGAKAFSEAWMIIECRKLVAQQFTPEAVYNEEAKAKWGKDYHKMFIGEILNVWVK